MNERSTFGAIAFAVVAAISLGIAMFLYWQSNQRHLNRGEGDESFNNRLDLFLSASIFICVITLLAAILAWPFILDFRFSFERAGSLSFGPLIGVLAMLSVIWYLAYLVANETTRSRFRNIRLTTFVSFSGRIGRPTFAAATALMQLQNLQGMMVMLSLVGLMTSLSPLYTFFGELNDRLYILLSEAGYFGWLFGSLFSFLHSELLIYVDFVLSIFMSDRDMTFSYSRGWPSIFVGRHQGRHPLPVVCALRQTIPRPGQDRLVGTRQSHSHSRACVDTSRIGIQEGNNGAQSLRTASGRGWAGRTTSHCIRPITGVDTKRRAV